MPRSKGKGDSFSDWILGLGKLQLVTRPKYDGYCPAFRNPRYVP